GTVPRPQEPRFVRVVPAAGGGEPGELPLPPAEGGAGVSPPRDPIPGRPGGGPGRRDPGGDVARASVAARAAAGGHRPPVLRGPHGGSDGRGAAVPGRNGEVARVPGARSPPRSISGERMSAVDDLERLLRAKADEVQVPPEIPGSLLRRARRRRWTNAALAGFLATALAVGGFAGVRAATGAGSDKP